jgi:glucose-1-phosphatase
MVKTVVFDIGNVVWRFRPLQTQLFRRWSKLMGISLHEFRLDFFEKDGLYRQFENDTLQLSDWFAAIAPAVGTQKFLAALDQTFSVSPDLDDSVIKIISTLRKNHLSVGCLSNTENFFYPYLKNNILSFFDYSILSWQAGSRKPDPKIYHQIFKYGHFLPSEILFIDDTPINVVGAQKLGLNSLVFRNAAQLKRDLRQFDLPISPVPKACTR